ncbi:MAG TPA: thioredoxin [Oscillospiraceae bacterium]|nr:thioredoxin [Oscillospiraceae bacterium]
MSVLQLKNAEFQSTISKSDKPVLVDFWAPWCGPCKMLAPILEEAASEVGSDAVIAKVNIDEESSLAERFGIFSIPTMIVFKDGEEVDRIVGLTSKEKILEHLSKD